jgi:hypothetical protein
MNSPTLQTARMLHILHANQVKETCTGMEGHLNENRVRTFIELTSQALEEDRIGQPDIFYRPKLTFNYPRSGRKRETKGLGRKG